MNEVEIEEYLSSLPYRYERDGYDSFLKKAKIGCNAPAIHIVGSNGKSSTAAYLSSIYVHNGYKVGLLTNLYVDSSLECIKINGKPIDEETFSSLYKEHRKSIEKFDLSRWEVLCAFAFSFFQKEGVDLMILDSSFGGNIDASFVEEENQKLVILTSLSLEHTGILGTTLSQIGLNKVNILQEGSKLLVPQLDEELLKLLRDFAEGLRSDLYVVDSYHFETLQEDGFHFNYQPYGEARISGRAKYLLRDASFALEATSILSSLFPVEEEKVYEGLRETFIPMCMEERGVAIFDASSNVESSEALVESLMVYGSDRIHMVFAAENESNIAAMLPFLSNYCVDLTLTTLEGAERIRKEDGYFFYTEDFRYEEDPLEAYKNIRENYPNDYVVFTGSKDFVRAMRKALAK